MNVESTIVYEIVYVDSKKIIKKIELEIIIQFQFSHLFTS
jgi:hypothetical protein